MTNDPRGHEKEARNTWHDLNMPSLLRGGTSAPAPAGGYSCALTMSPTGLLRPPRSPALRSLHGSQAVAKAAVADLRQPLPPRLPLLIDSDFTQGSEKTAPRPAPSLLSTNSVTLCLPVYL